MSSEISSFSNGTVIEERRALNGTTIPLGLEDRITTVPEAENTIDEVSEEDESFTDCDSFWTFFSLLTFIVDVGTDIEVAVSHYGDGNMWYFGLTLACILMPTIAMTGVNLRWYLIDYQQKRQGKNVLTNPKCVTFALLLIQPLLRYATILVHAWKARKINDRRERRKYSKRLVYASEDAAFLRLFESFLESAPQFLLQFYILVVDNKIPGWRLGCGMAISLISMAWAVVAHHKALRRSNPESAQMTCMDMGWLFMFLWRFFEIIARLMALALFASLNYNYFFGLLPARWILMSVCIMSMRTNFCNNKVEEVIYNLLLGGVFIFCYFNPKGGATRRRILIYYIFTFVENTVLMIVWYFFSIPHPWHQYSMVLQILSFVFAIYFMIRYYLCLHPTGNFLTKWTTIF